MRSLKFKKREVLALFIAGSFIALGLRIYLDHKAQVSLDQPVASMSPKSLSHPATLPNQEGLLTHPKNSEMPLQSVDSRKKETPKKVEQAKLAPSPEKSIESLKVGCFTVRYSHKKIPSHSDAETCMEHENEINLRSSSPDQINSKSICAFVEGKTVPFRPTPSDPSRIIIGAIAGPQSRITVRYCLGRSKCPQICVPKKDSFMSALGADDAESDASAGWDGSGTDSEESQLNSEVRALDQEKGQLDSKRRTFKEWMIDSTSTGCEDPSSSSRGVSE